MKKTLIALMALAGIACGAVTDYTGTELNTWLQEALEHRNGSKYTLTFTIADDFGDGNGSNLFQLSTDWAIREQVGRYVGFTIVPTGDSSISGNYVSRLANADDRENWDETTVIDTDTAGYSGWFYEGANNNAIQGATITIYSGDGDTRITLETSDQTVTLQRSTFYEPDENFKFGCPSSEVFKSASITFDSGTYSIPEPATATLSLLALAGLAARRRRK